MASPKRSHGVKVAGHTNSKTGANLPSIPSPPRAQTSGQFPPTGRTGNGKMGKGGTGALPGRT